MPTLFLVLFFTLLPIIFIAIYWGNFTEVLWNVLSTAEFYDVYSRTLKMSIMVLFICSILAYPTAYITLRMSPKWRVLMKSLIFLPVMVNPLVRGYGWLIILGREGLVNSLLRSLNIVKEPIRLLYTETAAELGLAELFFPFMFIPLLSAMENINEELILASRSLGAGSLRTFKGVILPLSLKGYLLGAATVLAGVFAAFITPTLLGGTRNRTLSMLLYEFVEWRFDWGSATAVAIITMISVLGISRGIGWAIKR